MENNWKPWEMRSFFLQLIPILFLSVFYSFGMGKVYLSIFLIFYGLFHLLTALLFEKKERPKESFWKEKSAIFALLCRWSELYFFFLFVQDIFGRS